VAGVKREQELYDDIYLSESYLVGLFWVNPDLYLTYSEDKINHKTFANRIWQLYFYLGKELSDTGKKIFDDITVEEFVSKTTKIQKSYREYGEYQTMQEIINEVREKEENFEGYYDEVKKFNMLRSLFELFGEQVITVKGKYNYKNMSSEQIGTYWQDNVNKRLVLCDSKIEEHNLLEGLEDFIEEINDKPDVGLPFDNSRDFTNVCNGWDFGHIYIFSSFSGKGKTSFAMAKVIMSCVKHKEKLLIIANEMGVREYKKLLLITIIGNEMYEWLQTKGYKGFHRQNIDKGNFSDEDKEKLQEATAIIKKVTDGQHDYIKFVPLDIYTISNVEKTIRYYANRGFRRLIIDTAKPSDGNKERWVQFTEDFEKIYKLARPNGGGLNLAVYTTVQLADASVKQRYLDETCLGDAKKIKNVASVVWHMRGVWDDEFKDCKREIKVYQYRKQAGTPKGYETIEFPLEKSSDHTYMLMFTSKNRRGMSNDTGLDVLVFKVSFNRNSWQEIGWTKIYKDY